MDLSEQEALAQGLCPVCSNALSPFSRGLCMGCECSACGWSVVTTNPHHPVFDTTAYTVWLVPGPVDRKSAIAAVALILGIDIKAARLAHDSGEPLERGVTGARVLELYRELKSRGMTVRVEPPPAWDLEAGSA